MVVVFVVCLCCVLHLVRSLSLVECKKVPELTLRYIFSHTIRLIGITKCPSTRAPYRPEPFAGKGDK